MRILHGSSFLPPLEPRPAVGIGNFDGVHLGHRALLDRLLTLAHAASAPAAVLTFRPHPAQLLRPAQAPLLLCDPQDEQEALAATGLELLIAEPFTRELAALTPAQFVQQILRDRLRATQVVVGFSFRFGARAAGTAEDLVRLADAEGIAVEIVPALTAHGEPVSSSRIRAAVQAGDVELAAHLLGRPFRLSGQVIHGQARGRTLGFPTVNLAPTTPLLPLDGIYAGWARLDPGPDAPRHPAAISIGFRPTFSGEARSIEAFLLDFDGNLYERRLSLELVAYLRPERRFAGPTELVEAMARDVARTRSILATESPDATGGCTEMKTTGR